jgi:hypothetical protein
LLALDGFPELESFAKTGYEPAPPPEPKSGGWDLFSSFSK